MYCKDRKNDLVAVYWHGSLMGNEEPTVRWCENCGAVVVDVDFDGRTNAGQIMKMRLPKIAKEVA